MLSPRSRPGQVGEVMPAVTAKLSDQSCRSLACPTVCGYCRWWRPGSRLATGRVALVPTAPGGQSVFLTVKDSPVSSGEFLVAGRIPRRRLRWWGHGGDAAQRIGDCICWTQLQSWKPRL
jgi:hypothetical protein